MNTWQAARRIVCVRRGGLGGVLMCTPALRALRAAAPGRTLTLLADAVGAAAAPFIPELDDAIACRGLDDGACDPDAERALADLLAARTFDGAVIFTGHTESALPAARLCRVAGIPLLLAHRDDDMHGLPGDWVPDPERAAIVRHEVQRQLALVRHIACAPAGLALSFVPQAHDVIAVRALLQQAGVDPDAPWLLLHPGAGAAARRYPPAHWAAALRLLARAPALPLVLTGSAAEAPLVEDIRRAAGVPSVSLAGRLGLGELGAALALAAVAVAGNTGPAHIAAAVGTPLVALYALTHPQHTPWAVPNRVLFQDVSCRFCFSGTCPAGHHACLAGVAPERVATAVLALLQARRAARGNAAGRDSHASEGAILHDHH